MSVPLGKGVLCLHLGMKRDLWVGPTSQSAGDGACGPLGTWACLPLENPPVWWRRRWGTCLAARPWRLGFGGAWKACAS